MPARVTLVVTQGQQQGTQFVFDDRTTTLIGKEDDCLVRFPKDATHQTISRHHCLLDVNSPDVRVRDLGSRNGTYVNGKLIGKRDKGLTREEAADATFAEFDLKDGDEVRLGPTTFHVTVYVPVTCADCGAEIVEEQKAKARLPSGDCLCTACRAPLMAMATVAAPRARVCARCGRDVSGEAGAQRSGEFVCAACRADPEQIAQRLLEMAKSGRKELLAVEGYAIDRELGRGGMGAVYLATHAEAGRRVALKVMLPQVAAGRAPASCSCARPSPRGRCVIATSSACSTWAVRRGRSSSRWSIARAAAWPIGSSGWAGRWRPNRRRASSSRRCRVWSTPTRRNCRR